MISERRCLTATRAFKVKTPLWQNPFLLSLITNIPGAFLWCDGARRRLRGLKIKYTVFVLFFVPLKADVQKVTANFAKEVTIQGEHKFFPWLQTFITRIRGLKIKYTVFVLFFVPLKSDVQKVSANFAKEVTIQGEHKFFPWLQTFITRKLRGIQTNFFLFKM